MALAKRTRNCASADSALCLASRTVPRVLPVPGPALLPDTGSQGIMEVEDAFGNAFRTDDDQARDAPFLHPADGNGGEFFR